MERSIEVFLVWGDGAAASVLAARYLGPGDSFSIGEAAGCDAFVPREVLGVERAEIVSWRPMARVSAPTGSRMEVEGAEASSESRNVAGDETVTIAFGDFRVRVRAVERETFPRARPATEGARGISISVVLHAIAFLLLAHLPARAAIDDASAKAALRARLLAASDERAPPPLVASSQVRRSALDESRRARAVSEQNIAPVAEHPKATLPAPALSPAGADEHSPRPTREEVATFGIIGLVQALHVDPGEPQPWHQALAALDDETVAREREMFSDPPVGGMAASLLSGVGSGGGGKAGDGEPVVLDIPGLTAAAADDAARMRAEDKGGFGHVRDTRGRLVGTAPPPIVPIPQPVIERIVRANGGRFRMCYGLGLRRNPVLEGRVNVAFTIGANGEVTEAADAGGELDDDVVRKCVVRAFYGLAFPKPMGGVPQKRTFPVTLRRGGE